MTEKKKTDWSFVDNLTEESETIRGELVEASSDGEVSLPSTGNSPNAPQKPDGILASFQAKKVTRRAAIEALTVNYKFQIDSLRHNLSKALLVSNAKADTMAKEFLMELDSQHLEVLGRLGLKNKETRERVLADLSESTANTLRELEQKDWPKQFIDEAIAQSLKLRARAIEEIMRDVISEGDDE